MNETTAPTLREKLAELIRNSGRTQKDLATASGVSQAIISSITTGLRSDLRAETVARLCRELGLNATALKNLMYESFPQRTGA